MAASIAKPELRFAFNKWQSIRRDGKQMRRVFGSWYHHKVRHGSAAASEISPGA